MSLRRFLVPAGALSQTTLELPPEEAAHARQVLRLQPGVEVLLLDGQGRQARAVLSRVERAGVTCQVLELREVPRARPRLVLCPGLLKAPAMELLAVKLCELGVDQVRPWLGPRTVPRPDAGKQARWQRLAEQALKQCGGGFAPEFQAPLPLDQVLAAAPAEALKLMPYEEERGLSLAQALAGQAQAPEVWGLVGPEGGFAPPEVDQARAAGFLPCGLGPLVLRAETASLALTAVIRLGR